MIKSRWIRGVGKFSKHGRDEKRVVGKPEGKRPLGRPRRRCENNIKMELRKIWWEIVDWLKTDSHDYVNNITIRFSRRTLLRGVSCKIIQDIV
jgi:hypothetical protein